MTGKDALDYLKSLCETVDLQAKARLRQVAVVAALPVAASFTVACYGAPDEPLSYEDTEAACVDGVDNDDDGDTDCDDSGCAEFTICAEEICDDSEDNDEDGDTDCDDSDCATFAACI